MSKTCIVARSVGHDLLASISQNPIFPFFANPCFVLFVHVHKTVQNNLATGLRPVARYGKKSHHPCKCKYDIIYGSLITQ